MKKKLKKLNKGFSLMETLIWVGIVGIFAGLIGVSGIGLLDRTRVKAAKSEMQTYSALLLDFHETEGDFPSEDEGLEILIEKDYVEKKEGDKTFFDPWGNEYIYDVVNDGNGFTLKCLGSDKKEGGTNTKKDIIVSHGLDEILDDAGTD